MKDDMRRTWKEYFEDMYNNDTEEQVAVNMQGFMAISVFKEAVILEKSQ